MLSPITAQAGCNLHSENCNMRWSQNLKKPRNVIKCKFHPKHKLFFSTTDVMWNETWYSDNFVQFRHVLSTISFEKYFRLSIVKGRKKSMRAPDVISFRESLVGRFFECRGVKRYPETTVQNLKITVFLKLVQRGSKVLKLKLYQV